MSTTVGNYARMNAEQIDQEIVKLKKRKAQINGTIELLYKLRKVEAATAKSEEAQSDVAISPVADSDNAQSDKVSVKPFY